jgi:hypothetical protein
MTVVTSGLLAGCYQMHELTCCYASRFCMDVMHAFILRSNQSA